MNKFVRPGIVKQSKGIILAPENAGLCFVLNINAQNGKYDCQLDKMLVKKWGNVRLDVGEWYSSQREFKLGNVRSVAVLSNVWIVNMLVKDRDGKINVDSLPIAMKKLANLAKNEKASVHISALLVNELANLKELVQTHLLDEGINVWFYEEPQSKPF